MTKKSYSRIFWSHVDICGPDDCWLWLLSTNSRGYGKYHRRGKLRLAHRIAWELHHKIELRSSKVKIRHSCDNRPCCNPRHLKRGSQKQNIRDMFRRGRRPKDMNVGVNNGRARLDEVKVKAIRILLRSITVYALSKSLKIPRTTLWSIKNRVTWRHVK